MNNQQNDKKAKAQPMKNIAQIMDELITLEQNMKSIYEKFTDQKTKSIVTDMFHDFSAKVKELGAHLSGSDATADDSKGTNADVSAKASSNVDQDAAVNEDSNTESDVNPAQMKNKKAKSGQSQNTRI